MPPPPHVEIDGHPAGPADLRRLALAGDGHLTTMQVRAGRVRGLALHLRRLDHANQELYGSFLDERLVRGRVRHALATAPGPGELGGDGNATVRVVVFPSGAGTVSVLVSVGPPAEPAATPLKLCSLRYERPFAHLKHVGTFGQIHCGRLARRRGFDDALLVTSQGLVCETTVANIGFVEAAARGRGPGDGGPGTLVWPQAPALTGVTMTLLDERLRQASPDGTASRRCPVRLADVEGFRAAFVVNARGLVPVERIDATTLAPDPSTIDALRRVYASVPWDEI